MDAWMDGRLGNGGEGDCEVLVRSKVRTMVVGSE